LTTEAAKRQARRRDRQRRGKLILQFEVDELATVSTLVAAGLLDPNLADNKHAIEQAAAKLFATLGHI
jgi:hypothetical protein